MNADLSAFYFDIRKDALYCDPPSSAQAARRAGGDRADLSRGDDLARAGAGVHRRGGVGVAQPRSAARSISSSSRRSRRNGGTTALARKWETIRALRSAVTGAIEIARADKEIGSSLEAAPRVYLSRPEHIEALRGVDFAEVCITSDIAIETGGGAPERAFRLPELPGRRGRRRAGAGRQMRALVALFRSGDRLARFPGRESARRRGAARAAGARPPAVTPRALGRRRRPRRLRGRPGGEARGARASGRRATRRRSRRFSISSCAGTAAFRSASSPRTRAWAGRLCWR